MQELQALLSNAGVTGAKLLSRSRKRCSVMEKQHVLHCNVEVEGATQ
jgi:hypothetical protein